MISASRLDAVPARPQQGLAGIGMMALSVAVFAGSNVIAKWLVADCPVGETLFVRCTVTLMLLLPFLRRRDLLVVWAVGRPWLHLLRLVGGSLDSICYYWAITVLPLADASAIYLAAPICVTGLSALFLGERVDWQRWAAVLVGFAGVLIALRPGGATLSVYALVALAGTVSYSASVAATRRLRKVPNIVLVASQVVGVLVFTGATAGGWIWPSFTQDGLLVAVGVLSMGGFLFLNRGLQLAPASVVTPLQYTGIVWAGVLGYLVFGDVPGASTLAGAAVIIAAGAFIVLRQRRGAP